LFGQHESCYGVGQNISQSVQKSSFPPLLDVVDNVFGVPQHYPPKFGLSSQKGGTIGVFGVLQHHPPKFGLSSWEGGTSSTFGVPWHYPPKFGLSSWVRVTANTSSLGSENLTLNSE